MRFAAKIVSMTTFMAVAIASVAHGEEGVFEINPSCAAGSGCFAGDSAGFPVQISTPGSYQLSSNLTAPNQNTTLISVAIAGVHVDLNGFTLLGTNTFPGPGGSCSAPGSGAGVSATANNVVVANGHVRGMGSHGVSLGTASSGCRVERLTAVANCGLGIQVPLTSLVSESIARVNGSHGIVGDSGSRVINSIADVNGGVGIRSITDTSELLVVGCVANANGSYGVFVGERSLVRGCVAAANGVHGIAALGRSQVVESSASRNVSRGISVLGSLASGDASTRGLNVAVLNGEQDFSGSVEIGYEMASLGVKTCP